MVYLAIFTILGGMVMYRLSFSSVSYLDHYGHKFLNYVVTPVFIGVIFGTSMHAAFPNISINVQILSGFTLGFVVQYFVTKLRRRYMQEVLHCQMKHNASKD